MTEIEDLLQALRAYEPERVYLFGSAARGEADELSDLDVVIIKSTTSPFLTRLREISQLLPPSIGAVDILVYTPEEFAAMQRSGNAFAQTVLEEGQLIYAEPEER
ncbi:MAG TPA: nucleotidyltransferase domain-containing protein [Acidobacteriota bacterium]|jgi:predicted nucleotidyltransferase|nr:nucleotidyltransferase domain-containing protein [Acidobacteriota bacterium]